MVDQDGIGAEMMSAIARVAPGTPLREALDNILRARTGALIVIGAHERVLDLLDGGFPVHAPVTPQHVYELSKLDGALILDQEARSITRANVQLVPDPKLPSHESGIKHRAAERLAHQTGEMVIAVSRRRNLITVYKGCDRYILRDVPVVLAKVDQALSTLDRYRSVLDRSLVQLTRLEFDNLVTVRDAVSTVGRAEMVLGMAGEIEFHVQELGREGRLARMQMHQLVDGVSGELALLIADYQADSEQDPGKIARAITAARNRGDLMPDPLLTARALGLACGADFMDSLIVPRGIRVLDKIPRLPSSVISNLVNSLGGLPAIMAASQDELDQIEGIGLARARTVRESLVRIRDQANAHRD